MLRMIKQRWHPGVLGVLWIADVVLLLTLWPTGAGAPVGAVLFMWLVPTLLLAAGTWWWLRVHRDSGPAR